MHASARATITTYHRLGGLKQWKRVLSEFWRLDVQSLSVSQFSFS